MIANGTVFVRHSARPFEGYVQVALFGLVELPIEGRPPQHVVHGVVAVGHDGDLVLKSTGHHERPGEDELPYLSQGSGVSDALRAQIWPAPSMPGFGRLPGGGLMLRHTRAPASRPDLAVSMVIGAMSVRVGMLPEAHLLDLTGDPLGTMSLRNPRPCPVETNGTTPCQIMQEPIWGWTGTPWGLVSTMDLDTIDACMEMNRLDALIESGAATDADRAASAHLDRHAAAWVARSSTRTDPRYAAFRAEIIAIMGPLRWDGVEDAAAQGERTRIAGEILRRHMAQAA